MRSMTMASLPRILRFRRVPKISVILSPVNRHRPSSQLRSKSLWMGKLRLKMKFAAILNLGDRVKAREIELLALLGGELRSQDQGPVVELLADDLRAEFVGGGLQRGDVVDGEEGVVGLAEADLRALQLLLDEAVPVEVVGGLERKERGGPHHHRAQGFVAEVEVVVREAAALAGEDAVIWILGGVFGDADAKARPLLHALEDEVDAVGVVPGHAAL